MGYLLAGLARRLLAAGGQGDEEVAHHPTLQPAERVGGWAVDPDDAGVDGQGSPPPWG